MSYSIYHDFIVKESMSEVYDAISQPKHLVNWWPLKCAGKPEKGTIYNFNFTDEYDWYAEVSSCKIDNHIHFKMTKSETDWDPTRFGFDLEEVSNGVKVQFWHKGWPECNAHFKHSSFCWAILLKGLKEYVETGAIIPFEKRS